MRNKGRLMLLLTLFVGLSLGIFFSTASSADAYPELSTDGKTCTPCHDEGEHGGQSGGKTPTEQTPAEQTPTEQTPVEQPAEEVHEKSPTNPYIVIGIVAVILAGIYVVAIRKKN